jgi:hypothetical protein
LAKELLAEMSAISLPEYVFQRRCFVDLEEVWYSEVVRPQKMASFTKAEIESRVRGLIPDLVLWNAGRPLIVEIAVTHRVDAAKLARIEASNIPAIEIRLSREDAWLPRAELREKLKGDLTAKHWLFHPDQRNHEKNFSALLDDTAYFTEAGPLIHAKAVQCFTHVGPEPSGCATRRVCSSALPYRASRPATTLSK